MFLLPSTICIAKMAVLKLCAFLLEKLTVLENSQGLLVIFFQLFFFFSTINPFQVKELEVLATITMLCTCRSSEVGGMGHQPPWPFPTGVFKHLYPHQHNILMKFLGRWKALCGYSSFTHVYQVLYFNFSTRLSQRKSALYFVGVKGCPV